MIQWSSLLVLCTVLTPALCCDWLRHYNYYSNKSLLHIHLMGGQLTEEESPVSFPYRLYRRIRHTEVDSQLIFIRDSLDLIFDLYHNGNLTSVTWDTDKTHRFLMDTDTQIEGLNTCVSTERRAHSTLRKYYRRLARMSLYCTGGGAVSWELIRKETQLHLEQLQLLVSNLLESTAASRRRHTPQH